MIHPSILSGIAAFVLWCLTDTSLKIDHVRDGWDDGKLTFWRTLSVVLVQIVLWTITGLFALWIVPHLPNFFLNGWRFSLTVFATAVVQWFALFMVLQYVWLLLRATVLTALYAIISSFRERNTIRKLERILREGNGEKGTEGPP